MLAAWVKFESVPTLVVLHVPRIVIESESKGGRNLPCRFGF